MFFLLFKLIDLYLTIGFLCVGVYFIIYLTLLMPFDYKKKTIKSLIIEFVLDCLFLVCIWPYYVYSYGKKFVNLLYSAWCLISYTENKNKTKV